MIVNKLILLLYLPTKKTLKDSFLKFFNINLYRQKSSTKTFKESFLDEMISNKRILQSLSNKWLWCGFLDASEEKYQL